MDGFGRHPHAGCSARTKQYDADQAEDGDIEFFASAQAGSDESADLEDPPRARDDRADPDRNLQFQIECSADRVEVNLGSPSRERAAALS